jgi:hypothetical protein
MLSATRDLKCGEQDVIDSNLQDMAADRFQLEVANRILNLDMPRSRMNFVIYHTNNIV